MKSKPIKNTLFDTLNWILKTKNQKPTESFDSNFLLNRWLSMTTPEAAKIINATGNRWCKMSNFISLDKIYYSFLPKFTGRISYIKKSTTQKENDDACEYAKNTERSKKDILFLEKALADLNITPK